MSGGVVLITHATLSPRERQRIVTEWVNGASERLATAKRTGDPSCIRAAASAYDEVREVVSTLESGAGA